MHARLHVHRFGPFFGMLAAGWAGSHRDGAIVMMIQLGHGLYTVKIRGHGDRWWPFAASCLLLFLASTCTVLGHSLGCWQLAGPAPIVTAQ